jgi:hypothetical protein
MTILIVLILVMIIFLIFYWRSFVQKLEEPFDAQMHCSRNLKMAFASEGAMFANELFKLSGDKYSTLFTPRNDTFELQALNCYC